MIESGNSSLLYMWTKEGDLHIVVCAKQTPDSAATINVEQDKAVWGESPMIVNPWDEYAIEEAIRIKERHGGHVTAITMGPDRSTDVLKTCLAMGCDKGVLISDEAFRGSDARATSVVLAGAIEKLGDVSLAFFGKKAIDGDTGLVSMSVARLLGWAPLSYVSQIVSLDDDKKSITVARLVEEGKQVCIGQMPAVISVVKDINEPRYPTFTGIRKASKVDYPAWNAVDLGLVPEKIVGLPSSALWAEMRSLGTRSGEGEIIKGDSPDQMAATLADRLMAEKVI